MNKKSNNKMITYILLSIFIVICIYLVFAAIKNLWPFETKYQIVSLRNGEVYYGHLSFFPSTRLTDVWRFQQELTEKEQELPQLNLVPFTSLFFGPKDVLYIGKDQIIWWSDLEEDSEVLKFIKSQQKQDNNGSSTEQSPQ